MNSFLLNAIVVKREAQNLNIDERRGTRLAVLSGMIPGMMGLVVGLLMARREAPAAVPPSGGGNRPGVARGSVGRAPSLPPSSGGGAKDRAS